MRWPVSVPAGEGDLLHQRVAHQHLAHLAPGARQHRQQSLWQPGLLRHPSPRRKPTSGDQPDGFTTTALPAASAGAIFCASEAMGEFHGVMAPTTPIGSHTDIVT